MTENEIREKNTTRHNHAATEENSEEDPEISVGPISPWYKLNVVW